MNRTLLKVLSILLLATVLLSAFPACSIKISGPEPSVPIKPITKPEIPKNTSSPEQGRDDPSTPAEPSNGVPDTSSEPAAAPSEKPFAPAEPEEEPAETEAPEIEYPEGFPPRMQSMGARDYLPEAEIVVKKYEDMEYSRPDTDAIIADFAAASATLKSGASAEEVLDAFYIPYDKFITFHTMSTLANIRYYADLTDEYYEEEYNFLDERSSDISEAMEAFLKDAATSSLKTELEDLYFGEGYLDKYVTYEKYTNQDYLALEKQETEIMARYHKIQEDLTITYKGKTGTLEDLLEEFYSYEDYMGVLRTYYDTFNKSMGECMVELIKVRQKMATVLGYSSYPEYAYDDIYGRDYTWEESQDYLAGIREYLVPLYSDSTGATYEKKASEEKVRACVQEVAERMGGKVLEAYNFLNAYNLSDLSVDVNKMDTSFTTYLYDYEAPYILMNSKGTTDDILTFVHEFGHFTDFYATYAADEDLETSETFSQGLEYLLICILQDNMSSSELRKIRNSKLHETVTVLVEQSMFADFENRIYALPENQITVDNLNSIFLDVATEYGLYSSIYSNMEFYFSKLWIDIPHFFESPCYVISYSVSCDTSLQIFQLEDQTPGAGVAAYKKLLERNPDDGIQKVAVAAGLHSPFEEGRLEELSKFLAEELGLN